MSQIATSSVNFPANGSAAPGLLARPSDAGNYPGIVLIQEWWGLVPHIRDVAQRFAREGFYTLSPDLYHGHTSTEPDEAQKLAMQLRRPQAIKEIHAAAKYLISLANVQPKKVGVVGFCMGGGLACAASAYDTEGLIGAVVAFYGRPATIEEAEKISAPLLGLYGELDRRMGREWVSEFDQTLRANNIPHELELYPHAPHAFFNDTRESYRPAAAQQAWQRTLDWFQKYLRVEPNATA